MVRREMDRFRRLVLCRINETKSNSTEKKWSGYVESIQLRMLAAWVHCAGLCRNGGSGSGSGKATSMASGQSDRRNEARYTSVEAFSLAISLAFSRAFSFANGSCDVGESRAAGVHVRGSQRHS